MHQMTFRRSATLLFAAALIGVAAVLVPAALAGSSSNGPPQTRIYGGGNIPAGSCTDGANTFCTQGVREFSILAIHDPNDNVTYGTITIARGAFTEVIRVTCLAVSGNVAEVGGVVVQANGGAGIGLPYVLFVRDSGQPGTVSRDGLSPSFVTAATPGKPSCNDVSSDGFGSGFLSLTYGDIAIQNVTNQNG